MCQKASAMIVMIAAGNNSQNVEIQAPNGGLVTYRTPRTCREMTKLPDAAEWLKAARDAIYLSILSLPGNFLMSKQEAKRQGLCWAHMVSTFKYKTDEHKALIKRKVRHSWDEARELRVAKGSERERLLQRACYTMPIGDADQCMLLATAVPDDWFTLIDWPDAYGFGVCDRGMRLVEPPPELDIRDEFGQPALIAIWTSLWGEGPAGFEWEFRRDMQMEAAGWARNMTVPGAFYHGDDRAGVIIDDMLVRTRGGNEAALQLAAHLDTQLAHWKRTVVVTVDVTLWGGMMLSRSPCRRVITTSLPHYIEAAAATWLPQYLTEGVLPAGVPRGAALRKALDKLRPLPADAKESAEQKDSMSLGMVNRWIANRVTRIMRHAHLVSRVLHRVPDGTLACCLGTLALACDYRHEGRSYGLATGDGHCRGILRGTQHAARRATIHVADPAKMQAGAPVQMEGYSDVNWGILQNAIPYEADGSVELLGTEEPCADTIALAVTVNGAAVLVELKMAGIYLGSSAEGEGLGLLKLSDKVVYLSASAAAFGMPQDGPVMLLCDAEAALRVAAGESSAARLRHALRRSAIVTQRVRGDECALAHVPDAAQVVDFLTKWKEEAKVDASIAYLGGFLARAATEMGNGNDAYAPVVLALFAKLAEAMDAIE
jgi:hypothetical protein